MTLRRLVKTEILDALDVKDPAALRSRRDLQRVHRFMGTRSILERALLPYGKECRGRPLRLLELGAGDGSLMLGVARRLFRRWPQVELTMIDQRSLVGESTHADYAAVGWKVNALVTDFFDWAKRLDGGDLAGDRAHPWDLVIANLFLHHFDSQRLVDVLRAVATSSRAFFACEPRRESPALIASHLVGLIGANAVTRADAVTSVIAGFRGHEISASWRRVENSWDLQEYPAGLFSHCFHARFCTRAVIDER